MIGELSTAVEILKRIPLIGRLLELFSSQEDPRIAAVQELGQSNSSMIDAMKHHDNPKDMTNALQDYNPRFRVGDEVVEKDFGARGPFDRIK